MSNSLISRARGQPWCCSLYLLLPSVSVPPLQQRLHTCSHKLEATKKNELPPTQGPEGDGGDGGLLQGQIQCRSLCRLLQFHANIESHTNTTLHHHHHHHHHHHPTTTTTRAARGPEGDGGDGGLLQGQRHHPAQGLPGHGLLGGWSAAAAQPVQCLVRRRVGGRDCATHTATGCARPAAATLRPALLDRTSQ